MTHILLDTNAYTGLMNGDTVIYDRIVQADIVYMSVIILGELYTGFYGGSKPDWNISVLKDFLEKETIKIKARCNNLNFVCYLLPVTCLSSDAR